MSNHKIRRANDSIAEIVIRLLPTGQIRVTGPLAKEQLCKEMLREAIKVVENFQKEITRQIVTPEQKAIIEV